MWLSEKARRSQSNRSEEKSILKYHLSFIDAIYSSRKENLQIYHYQKDLLKYLIGKDDEFAVKSQARRKGKVYLHALRYYREFAEDYDLKPVTLLLAVYLFTKAYQQSEVPDVELLKYINPCLWVASKNEQYFPLRPSALISRINNDKHLSKGKCAMIQTLQDLLQYELALLVLMNFKIFTPPVFDLVELFRAEMLGESSRRYSSGAQRTILNNLGNKAFFEKPLSLIALGAMYKEYCQRDEEGKWSTLVERVSLPHPMKEIEQMSKLLIEGESTMKKLGCGVFHEQADDLM